VKIVSVESFGTEEVALVRVRTDEGAEGWGQVAPYHADITAQVLHRQVALVEFSIEPDDDYPWQVGLYEPRPRVVEGNVEVPEAPGGGSRSRPSGSRGRAPHHPRLRASNTMKL